MSEQQIPEHLKHLVGEISEKDLRRLAEIEPEPPSPVFTTPPATTQPQVAGYVEQLQTLKAELDTLRPITDKEAAEEDGFKLPTAEDLAVAGTVSVLSVGVVVEAYYRKFLRVKRAYQRQSRMARGIEMIALACVILMVIGWGVLREVKSYIRAHEGPFLEDALVAPYNLDTQTISSASHAQYLVPASIGSFLLSEQPITRSYTSSPTNQCLLGLGYERDIVNPPTCVRNYGASSVGYGRYMTDWKTADLVVARFPTDYSAERTMFELLHHARQYGQVGNFAIGTGGPVDYFYSSVQGWLSFTWSHGPWIFSVSAPTFATTEEVVKQYNIPQLSPQPAASSSGA